MFGTNSGRRALACALLAAAVSGQGAFVEIGTGNLPCGSFGSSCGAHIFWDAFTCAQMQVLVDASEMAGVAPGTPLLSLSVFVTDLAGGFVWPNVEVALGHSSVSSFNSLGSCDPFVGSGCTYGWIGGLTTVRGPFAWAPTAGWTVIPFDTPFVWNGVDHLVVDLRFSNPAANPISLQNLGLLVDTTLGSKRTTREGKYGVACPFPGPDFDLDYRITMRFGYCPNATALSVAPGCSNGPGAAPALTGTPPVGGQPGMLSITGAPPFGAGLLYVGASGQPAYPLMNVCNFYVLDGFIWQVAFMDAAGNWTFTDVIPNAPGLVLDVQAILLSGGPSPYFQTTNLLRLTIGC